MFFQTHSSGLSRGERETCPPGEGALVLVLLLDRHGPSKPRQLLAQPAASSGLHQQRRPGVRHPAMPPTITDSQGRRCLYSTGVPLNSVRSRRRQPRSNHAERHFRTSTRSVSHPRSILAKPEGNSAALPHGKPGRCLVTTRNGRRMRLGIPPHNPPPTHGCRHPARSAPCKVPATHTAAGRPYAHPWCLA